jgi:NhaA family Na+:H+ antiporter
MGGRLPSSLVDSTHYLSFELVLALTLHQWVSDGLMAVFFLHVGLEIKRELVAGELSSLPQAALPIAGAVGGMVVPAAIYLLANHSGIEARGWGIPMATDIAFALGTLTLIAPRISVGAKVFLTALAIVDDMGAVVVIALVYTATLNATPLAFAALTLAALVALNKMSVGRLAPYLLFGALLWYFTHQSGIHATIAGVLLAFTIPTRTRYCRSRGCGRDEPRRAATAGRLARSTRMYVDWRHWLHDGAVHCQLSI